jgi:hypothetical protein
MIVQDHFSILFTELRWHLFVQLTIFWWQKVFGWVIALIGHGQQLAGRQG